MTVPAGGAPPRLAVPVGLAVWTALAAALVVTGTASPLRTAVVGGFVLVVPGAVVVDAWQLARGALAVTLAVAISSSLVTAVLLLRLLVGSWSIEGAFLDVVGATAVALLVVIAHRVPLGPAGVR